MKVQRRDADAATVLQLSGRLVGETDRRLLDSQIAGLIAEHRVEIVIDLARLAWLNSVGLGVLIAAFDAVRRAGGHLKLCAVNDRIEDLLGGSGLYSVFDVFRTEEDALASFPRRGPCPPDPAP